MDEQVLSQAGAKPANPRRAWLADYALRIGQRATLVPSPGARAYGMLIALTPAELDALYDAPGLEGYRPEEVLAHPFEGEAVPALCYMLSAAPRAHERNPEYALRLRAVLERLGFPHDYITTVT